MDDDGEDGEDVDDVDDEGDEGEDLDDDADVDVDDVETWKKLGDEEAGEAGEAGKDCLDDWDDCTGIELIEFKINTIFSKYWRWFAKTLILLSMIFFIYKYKNDQEAFDSSHVTPCSYIIHRTRFDISL